MDGYIYVLINPSMPGLVKIGRTTRNPESREKELSQATGVPTPFIMVYYKYFVDCQFAEEYIHNVLSEFRITHNREFFDVPIYEVIDLITKLEDSTIISYDNRDNVQKKYDSNIDIANDLLVKAYNLLWGLDNNLQDYSESLKLFNKAAKLGSIEAYHGIGCVYLYREKMDIHKALEAFKKGAKLGDNYCYAEMALIYCYDLYHMENSLKCWKNYFSNISESYKVTVNDYTLFRKYILQCYKYKIEILHMDILALYKQEIIDEFDQYLDFIKSKYSEEHIEYNENMDARSFFEKIYDVENNYRL